MSDDVHMYRRFLPHWRVAGAVYFVTWRLHDEQEPLTVLERDQIAQVIRYFDGERFELFAYVVMNDHVHAMLRPRPGVMLQRIIHSWKSYSTAVLHCGSRRGKVWQREYYDHVIRGDEDFAEKLGYIMDNPYRRWPGIEHYPWVWCREDFDDSKDA
jgi:REP element-mobilizing transposase RayT